MKRRVPSQGILVRMSLFVVVLAVVLMVGLLAGLWTTAVALEPEVDLVIEKVSDPDRAIAGEPLTYEIIVENKGTGRAQDVVVSDTLPIQVEFIAHTLPAACTLGAGSGPGGEDQLVCELGDVSGGESASFKIEVSVDADAVANDALVLTNTAEVGSLGGDRDPSNNTVTLVTILEDSADLRVTKLCKPDDEAEATPPGVEGFFCTFFVDNLGPSYARKVSIRDESLADGTVNLVRTVLDPNRDDQGPFLQASPEGGQTAEFDLNEELEPQDIFTGGRWVVQMFYQAPEGTDFNNAVSVFTRSGGTPDPDMSNNQAFDSISVEATADLELGKVDAGIPRLAGEPMGWGLNVTNHGPSTAENVVVEDFLPAGVTVVSVTPTQGSCTTGTPGDPAAPVVCSLGNLAAGAQAHIDLTVDVHPDYPVDPVSDMGWLENDAVVSSDSSDPDSANNRAFTLTQVIADADLVIEKFAEGPFPWVAGEERTWLVNVWNNGPSLSQHVEVIDQLPPEVEFLGAYVELEAQAGGVPLPCGLTSDNTVVCPLGDLMPGPTSQFPPSARVFIDVGIKADVPSGTVISNVADVLSDTPDSVGGNQRATQEQRVETGFNLIIEKTSNPPKQYAGEQVRYTIEVTNEGPSAATGVQVVDTFPDGVFYEIDDAGCVADDESATCDVGGMGPGEVREINIWVLVDPAMDPDEVLENEVCVGDGANPPSPGDGNCAYAETLVLGKADLRVTKFGKPDGEVRTGDILTYTVVVDNHGPGYAWDAAVKDVLQSDGVYDLIDLWSDEDARCTLLVGDTTVGPFDVLSQPWPPPVAPKVGVDPVTGYEGIQERLELDCVLHSELEVLAAEEDVGPPNPGRWILTMRVRAYQSQDMNNVADVVASTYDPNLDNNHAEVLHEITDVANLMVTKEAEGLVMVKGGGVVLTDSNVTAGLYMTYTVTVKNNGPARAENVVVEDTLPAGIVVTGVASEQGVCTTGEDGEHDNPLTCDLGTLDDGDEVDVTVWVSVPASVPCNTLLENDVVVYSDMFDADMSDNRDHNLTLVNAQADLGVSKVQSPDIVLAGTPIKYTIEVWNQGPSDAPGVEIEDLFPGELTGVSWECVPVGTGATCPEDDPSAGDLEHSFDVPVGTYVYFTVRGVRKPYPDWSFTNEVRVSTGGCAQDPVLSDNVASDTNEPHMTFLPVIGNIRFDYELADLKVKELWAAPLEPFVRVVNEGPLPVTGPFWVDLYIDPVSAPAGVGQQWKDLAEQGAVWYVMGDVLPLEPGDTVGLHIGDEYYLDHLSKIEWPIEKGSTIYAQVDSRTGTHGMVYESHEAANQLYNNIKGPVISIQ